MRARWSAILARYASRFSVRALDLHVDSTLLWVGALLARDCDGAAGVCAATAGLEYIAQIQPVGQLPRIAGSTNRRLRIFAITQIAASFVLLAGASMLLKTLLSLQTVRTAFDTRACAGDQCSGDFVWKNARTDHGVL